MAKRPGIELRFAASARALNQRLVLVGLLAASLGLLVLCKAEAPLVDRVRIWVGDVMVPVFDALSRPVNAVQEAARHVGELAELRSEVERLREENARLLAWQAAARRLDAENRGLRDVLHFPIEPTVRFVTARVVAVSGGSFLRSVLVNAGSRDGVERGRTAITGDGLVGRVSEVGERSARILLLSDLNSQVPVLIESSRERAILTGDNSDRPRLTFFSTTARPQVGDRLVTSGHGGVYPPGLPVGLVVSVNESSVRVQPFADLNRLEYVRLVEYQVEGALPGVAPPPTRSGGRR